jgi:HAD superfamily hydrolase (TIGR01450 family)
VDPWVLDLDGVVWLGGTPIPGAADAVARLRAHGRQVWCCTNNSAATVAEYEEKLADHGIEHDGIITSAMAMGTLIRSGETILACAGPGAREAIIAAGGTVVDGRDPAGGGHEVDAVVIGFHRDFDYAELHRAMTAIRGGARLIATNDDPIYPDAEGPAPGCGAILAAVERASGVAAAVAGKPNPPMVELVRRHCGASGVLVGDSAGTDGALAEALGWSFGLVLSGNTSAQAAGTVASRWVAADLAELVSTVLGDE